MRRFLAHLFIPKESNNFRAKILHHTNIILTIAFLFSASLLIQKIGATYPSVLGISANISSDQLLFLTNQERQSAGVGALVINDKLSQAAMEKANDMFTYNYWAHISPSGKTPWVFIKAAGYNYVYAGENLAKGFTTADSVVKAWMASPDHRANMLSTNYNEVGFAVQTGTLNGEEIILVVEEFGSIYMPTTSNKSQEITTAQKVEPDENIEPVTEENSVPEATGKVNIKPEEVQAVKKQPLINTAFLSSNIYYAIVLIFIFTFILDMIIIEKKKVVRFVGHNIDHILYLFFILALIGIWTEGVII